MVESCASFPLTDGGAIPISTATEDLGSCEIARKGRIAEGQKAYPKLSPWATGSIPGDCRGNLKPAESQTYPFCLCRGLSAAR